MIGSVGLSCTLLFQVEQNAMKQQSFYVEMKTDNEKKKKTNENNNKTRNCLGHSSIVLLITIQCREYLFASQFPMILLFFFFLSTWHSKSDLIFSYKKNIHVIS